MDKKSGSLFFLLSSTCRGEEATAMTLFYLFQDQQVCKFMYIDKFVMGEKPKVGLLNVTETQPSLLPIVTLQLLASTYSVPKAISIPRLLKI